MNIKKLWFQAFELGIIIYANTFALVKYEFYLGYLKFSQLRLYYVQHCPMLLGVKLEVNTNAMLKIFATYIVNHPIRSKKSWTRGQVTIFDNIWVFLKIIFAYVKCQISFTTLSIDVTIITLTFPELIFTDSFWLPWNF